MTAAQRKVIIDMGYRFGPGDFWWRDGYSYRDERAIRSALRRARSAVKILSLPAPSSPKETT